MAELKDIFALEAEREMPESWNKIHLYKVGDFWRAYEWSACGTTYGRLRSTGRRSVMQ